jgi:hypothetical protein
LRQEVGILREGVSRETAFTGSEIHGNAKHFFSETTPCKVARATAVVSRETNHKNE